MTSKPTEPPLPWPAQLRVGDELRLRVVDATFADIVPAVVYVSNRSYPPMVMIGYVQSDLPAEVGSLVENTAGSRGRVRGIACSWAWVAWLSVTDAGAPTTVPLRDLRVVDDGDER